MGGTGTGGGGSSRGGRRSRSGFGGGLPGGFGVPGWPAIHCSPLIAPLTSMANRPMGGSLHVARVENAPRHGDRGEPGIPLAARLQGLRWSRRVDSAAKTEPYGSPAGFTWIKETVSKELEMLTVEERALLTDLQDRIIALLVERQEAWARGDRYLVEQLTRRIDRLKAECTSIRQPEEAQYHRF